MSNAIFPTLQGITFDSTRTPEYSTLVHRAISGRETRIAQYLNPLVTFSMRVEALQQALAEWHTLEGFFRQRQGQFDSFLYADPNDKTATAQTFATADGVATQFQIIRTIGGASETVQNVIGTPVIYKTIATVRTLATGWTMGATGIVTFTVAPVVGAVLDWTGQFYHRVRFTSDTLPVVNMLTDLYNVDNLSFVGSPANLV